MLRAVAMAPDTDNCCAERPEGKKKASDAGGSYSTVLKNIPA
jgi:hypothetical protein